MTAFIDLNRRFQQLTEKELEDVDHLISLQRYGIGTSVGWPELLEHDRVILLAEAGSGKTREMRAQAERLVGEGRFAFFITLESIKDSFFLESVSDDIQFNAWKDGGEAIAWFFLDSVDELKLTRGKLEKALRHLSRAVHDHLIRTRTVISCHVLIPLGVRCQRKWDRRGATTGDERLEKAMGWIGSVKALRTCARTMIRRFRPRPLVSTTVTESLPAGERRAQ